MVYTHMVGMHCHSIYASVKVLINLVITNDIVSCIRNAPMQAIGIFNVVSKTYQANIHDQLGTLSYVL